MSRATEQHTIWSNIDLNFDDWKNDLETEHPELSESELMELMYETNNDYLDDERTNLNVQLSQSIIVIADLGLWNGRFAGYKMIESGNIRDCLYSDADMTEWFVDKKGEFRADAIHHDGRNYYLYRVFKDGITDEQIENLQEKIYSGTATKADIDRVTRRLGDEIAKVNGFDLPKQKKAVEMER